MVFESLVTDLINKYLGDYVENLDRSQLKLGIWGGDAVLENLDLKESALDDLDLPVKIKAGHIGKLTLKIPWKNLYTEPVIASLDGVYALAVPNFAIQYNAEKEEKEAQDAKQKKLQQIEEAKRLEAEKNKPKEPKKDSFAEKMATQIIKNLQIHIKNIHVRYEDMYTNPNSPFSIGITLQELLFQTTDENWKPCILKEAVTQIYKLIRLDSLAVYWNSQTICFEQNDKKRILECLKEDIASKEKKTNNQYLLKPISLVSHLRLNTKPEMNGFTIPKIYLTIVFDDIAVQLMKNQYNNILEMLDSMERMRLRGMFRKYRPEVALHKNAKTWWHYAINSILEEYVRRRRRMWSWQYMIKHRKMMKQYREAYVKKLGSKKVPSDVQKAIEECEKEMDVFSITLMRQQAEVEAAKLGAQKEKEKEERGWFGGLFGGKKKKNEKENIQDQFKELYTPDEKAKLYSAIGYEENEADPTLPKEFVAVKFVTKLSNISLTLREDAVKVPLLKVQVKDMFTSFGQRPAANAIQLESKLDKFIVSGIQQNGVTPKLVLSQNEDEEQINSLVNLQVETNPLDGACDTRVRMNAQPLQIVYDAVTINNLAEFFKPPREIYLEQISKSAVEAFEQIKEQSAAGLQHAIEQRKYTDIILDVKAPYIVVPYGGFYKRDCQMLVLDLGNLKVTSEKNQTSGAKKQVEAVEELMKRAYDKFNIKVDRIQLMYAHPGQNWNAARKVGRSDMHILEPISINISLQKCMFDKDPRMSKMKVFGELPLLSLCMSDTRLQDILKLVESIPFPESSAEEVTTFKTTAADIPSTDLNANQLTKAVLSDQKDSQKKELERSASQDVATNYTDLELQFEIKEVCISLLQQDGGQLIPILKLVVESLGTMVTVRTFDMNAEAYLGGIYLQYQKEKATESLIKNLQDASYEVKENGALINIINTPDVAGHMGKLLNVVFCKANPEGPDFETKHKKTEQSLSVKFASLEILLHKDAILSLIAFADGLKPPEKAGAKPIESTETNVVKEDPSKTTKPTGKSKKKVSTKDPEIIDLKINAQLQQLGLAICTKTALLTDVKVKGIEAQVTLKEEQTAVSAMLKAVSILDPDPYTLYPKIMEIQGEAVLKLDLVIYNGATEGEKYSNMSCVDTSVAVTLGCIHVVFLNKFVNDLLRFVADFQGAFEAQVKKAGETISEMSSDALSKLQEKAPRVALNIKMDAPLIVVPKNSKSSDVLIADFGELTIQNAFHLAGKVSPSGYPAVLDKMGIKLTSLKLMRAITTLHGGSRGECLILEPVTVTLELTRNLSATWYHDQPAIDVSGKMDAVVASMSQGDFTMVMTLLNENLTEGQTPEAQGQGQLAIEDTSSQSVQVPSQTDDTTAPSQTVAPQPQGQTTPSEVHSQVKFSFQITSLCAALYTGDSDLTSSGGKRNPAASLGKVELQFIALNGEIMTNNSIQTKVILKDTILDDLRPQKQKGVTRMIERNQSDKQSSNMIDVSFTQDTDQNKDIDVKVSSLYICVCLDYLMSLANFFKMPESSTPTPPPSSTQQQAAEKPKAPAESAPAQGTMRLKASMEKPEILLIEDQSNPASSALKLETELKFGMHMMPEKQEMQATIHDLQILTCVFNTRKTTGTQILNPCDISFYSSTPQGKGAHMDVNTTDLILNISPATIRLMSKIAASLSTQQEEEKKKEEQVPPDLWVIKKLQETNFWFLKTPGEESPVDPIVPLGLEDEDGRGEQSKQEDSNMFKDFKLIAKIPSMVVKLEGGVGNRTVPLLIVETSFQGEVKDWSSKLSVDSSVKLEVAYYNEKLTVWEPFVEPIVENGKQRPWQLSLDVNVNDDLPLPEDEEDAEVITLPPPKMSINIHSEDSMELTMSKTCLDVLNNLGKAFNEAYMLLDETDGVSGIQAPYVISNHTGIDMIMKLDNSFEMPEDAENCKVKMPPNKKLQLFNRKKPVLSRKASVIKATQEGEERKIIFQVEEFQATREITIKRAEKRFYHINNVTHHDKWAVVVSTEANIGQRVISLRSNVQVRNTLPIAVEVYYNANGRQDPCGRVDPGETFNAPLSAVYSTSGEFYFKPLDAGYKLSKEPVTWRAAENMGTKQLTCEGPPGSNSYFIRVKAEVEQIYYEESESLAPKCYTFVLSPTVIFHNLLPFPVKFLVEGTGEEQTLQKGENTPLGNACVGKTTLEMIIPMYRDKEWCGRRMLQADIPELSMCTFEAYVGAQKVAMNLGLHCKQVTGSLDVTLYSPYWMINKTYQTLTYKGSDSEDILDHHHDNKEAVLFSFKPKAIFSKKKRKKHTVKSALAEPAFVVNTTLSEGEDYRREVNWKDGKNGKDPDKKKVREWRQSGKASLKIGDAEWSEKFSLDTVGSSGTVQCKSKGRVYEVGVKIHLSSSGLTKVVTFTPFYMLLNTASFPLMCTETTQAESWFEVQPGECLPFWPMQSGKDMSLKVKVEGSDVTTPFLFNKAHTTLLRLDDEVGGINVNCQVTELAMVTTFSEYRHGMAAVQIVNHTQAAPITFHQSGVKMIHLLNPDQYMIYTWENTMGKREILWSCGQKKEHKDELIKDGIGEFFLDSDTKIYWVSFLDGMQRVILFTEDLVLATYAQQAGELERIEQEINVCIQGMGLSLVNDYTQKEVAFVGITSSGIIWEEKRKRYKALNVKTTRQLEEGYQKYLSNIEAGHNYPPRISLDSKLEIDFSEMMMYKPNKRTIRRSFQDGIWLQYKTSPHQMQLHAKINRFQLDNQLSGAVFPTVLSPVPLPKSVAAESVPKPFTEVSIMLRKHEHSNMMQFKYFKVLVQEMQLKVDQGFLNQIIELFSSNQEVSREQATQYFIEDYEKIQVKLMDEVGLSLAVEQNNFYDYLHFSPIKMHLSFSLQGGGGDGKATPIQADVINIFLQSVGVVLTDVQDVVFKLGYFQKEHMFYNQPQLLGEMTRHYAGQAIKQMYVLVLGLDVLGNPFGLIRGMAEGIEDLFYEPYQGAIQGPEEFAEGLALGVRSLFGHAVGGAAGAVSRITGTLGKGLAALTLDDDYQKKRREQMNKRPASAREGFARGGKGLVMGVFDGVTGIVRKPIEGAKKEGVEGFFKGVGKGLVGVVTRPTSGVIDFASSSFEGIKRITELSDEIQRIRPPRRFHADRILRPYNRVEAEGYAILAETEKGKFVATDEYLAHVVLSRDGKHVFIVTDKRVIFASRGDIFGHWDADWTYMWVEIKERPKLSARGIEIILKEKEKKKFFGSSVAKKEVAIGNPKLAQMILNKISEAMARSGR